jgi:hypothetical protein
MTGQENNQAANDNSVSVNPNSSANAGNNKTDENAVYQGDSSWQSPEEYASDKKTDHASEDNELVVNKVDDLQSNSDGAAGTDRAGTAERKPFGDTELNKGLEAQAQDVEST